MTSDTTGNPFLEPDGEVEEEPKEALSVNPFEEAMMRSPSTRRKK
jgi:hypothetical protein